VKILPKILFAVVTVAAATQAALGEAAKSEPAAKPVPSRSVFVMPANTRDGRDPFYPESSRPYEAAAASTRILVEVNTLALKGVLGTPGHYVAIINNHAFAVGDEGEVRTQGGSAHIRCLEIRANVAIVEINGQRHELTLGAK
jgi:hypothetical protein